MALAVEARAGCCNLTSDNTAGAMPEVLAALTAAVEGTAPAYGNDGHTKRVNEIFSQVFERECQVFPVATGTAANALGIAACCKPWSAVLCHEGAHIHVDEAGAVEAAACGVKLIPISGPDSKLTAESVRAQIEATTSSARQVNESGLLYTLDELDAIGAIAREKGIRFHMDGARFGNSVEGLGCSPADVTWRRGVDVLSFGGTKNGCLAAEAVVFFAEAGSPLVEDFRLRLKRSGHMWSKMRFLSSQLLGYLGKPTDGAEAPWRKGARHGNKMAALLGAELTAIHATGGGEGVQLLQRVEANEVFLSLPAPVLEGVFTDGHTCLDIGALSGQKGKGELLRCVCSWDTKETELREFIACIRAHVLSQPKERTDASGVPAEGVSVKAAPAEWPGLPAVPLNTKAVFSHPVSAATDPSLAMPVFCVRGATAGPTLLTLTGVHGDEFEPMAAAQDVYRSLDPKTMAGTWLCVGCTGVAGYLAANRLAPSDGKNLARCFPGCESGTYTEQVAFALVRDFISLPEVAGMIDLHSAGKVARMVTLVGYNLFRDPQDAKLGAASQALARAMAMPLVWGHRSDPAASAKSALNEETSGRTTLYGAYLQRKPAVYCETTGTGGIDEVDVQQYVAGVHRALAHFEILSPDHPSVTTGAPRLDTVDPPPAAWGVDASAAAKAFSGHLQSQNITPVGGIWRCRVKLWDTVVEGDLIGDISDHFGNGLFQLRAQVPGTVVLLRHLARVEAGDFLAVIAPGKPTPSASQN